jgi:hypothetical protein
MLSNHHSCILNFIYNINEFCKYQGTRKHVLNFTWRVLWYISSNYLFLCLYTLFHQSTLARSLTSRPSQMLYTCNCKLGETIHARRCKGYQHHKSQRNTKMFICFTEVWFKYMLYVSSLFYCHTENLNNVNNHFLTARWAQNWFFLSNALVLPSILNYEAHSSLEKQIVDQSVLSLHGI